MGFLSKLFGKKPIVEIEEFTLTDNNIEQTFNELEDLYTKKQRINQYLEEIDLKEKAYEKYKRLDKVSLEALEKSVNKIKQIKEQKQNLRGRLISNNSALSRIMPYEKELPNLIKEMKIAENRRKETEGQMLYLKEERVNLEDDREDLLKAYSMLKGVSIFLVILIGVALITSFVLLQVLREGIWITMSILVIVVVGSMVGVMLYKDKLEREISDNEVLQQKAVKLLNKVIIRFFNQTQYLDFQYKKLGVESVAQLELYYNRYMQNKDNENTFLRLNDALSLIDEDIMGILQENHIEYDAYNVREVVTWLIEPKRANEMQALEEERRKTKEQLISMEHYEQEMWKEIAIALEDNELKDRTLMCLSRFKGENLLDNIMKSSIQ